MKTRIKNLLLLLFLLALPAVVQAQDAYSTNADGSIYTYSTNADGSANIVAYAGHSSVLTIPTNINSLTVTSIGDSAFEGDNFLTSVTIPNSVTSIGADAFFQCYSLTNATIHSGDIGEQAFYECYSLTNATIHSGDIGEQAFYECYSLTSVTIDNGVTSIGEGAFVFCHRLTNITIPASVTNMFDAFGSCTNLAAITVDTNNPAYSSLNGVVFDKNQATLIQYPGGLGGSYSIPNSVTSIGGVAFGGCTRLTNVMIPNSVTTIGEGAFVECTALTSVIFLGNAPGLGLDVFAFDPATVYYLPGTTGWASTFGSAPTATWTLPYPLILNNNPSFGVQNNQFGFTISWATNLSIVVEACTNLANPVWTPIATNAIASGTNYFSDPQWTNFPMRFYRAAGAFTVGGSLTGLPAGDTVTLQDNGSDNLTLSTNGTFTFPTALPNGHAYSITVSGTSGGTRTFCTLTNDSGTISSANVTNVAVQCTPAPPLTGNLDVDMYNAAVADGTANGGVPGVMLTENGGPFRVTAPGQYSVDVALRYSSCKFAVTVGSNSCSSTTFTNGTPVIQFGTGLVCSPQVTYGY